MLALSGNAWLSYNYLMKHHFLPLTDGVADSAASFVGDKCKHGMVLFAGKSLRIVEPNALASSFTDTTIGLSYTPRKILYHEKLEKLVILETEHNILDAYQRAKFRERAS